MSGQEFGKKLREFRKEMKVSSRVLSKTINKAETYVSQIERGLNENPDYDACKRILMELDFSEEESIFLLNEYEIYTVRKRLQIHRLKRCKDMLELAKKRKKKIESLIIKLEQEIQEESEKMISYTEIEKHF